MIIRKAATTLIMDHVCVLKPKLAEHHVIYLNAGRNVIGRQKETGIRDTRVSKQQLEFVLDSQRARIKLKVLGINPCSVNGVMMMQSAETELEHGDVVELVYGRHPFEVQFKPPPPPRPSQATVKDADHDSTTLECWESVDSGKMMIYTSAGVRASAKVASYDIDGTIIKTKSGNVFPKHADDWQLNYPDEVKKKLLSLHENGYKICFFTNQAGIGTGQVKLDDFKKKVRQIVLKVGVPVQVYIAIMYGYFRKPLPGMWEHLQAEKNNGVQLQLDKCFFVGDAAGRPEIGAGATKRRKDHSLADRLFAANLGISFYTPEEHFLNRRIEDWSRPGFEPQTLNENVPLVEPNDTKLPADKCEMIIMVGLPGSGKSTFCQQHLVPLGYTVANADTLGSTKACLTQCESALKSGKSCAVDNTNVDIESRKKFIALAVQLQIPCRCFVMNVTLPQVKHNLAFRHLTDSSHSKINDMIFNGMKKRYVPPTVEEGCTSIVKINLSAKFRSMEEERLYKLYLVEK